MPKKFIDRPTEIKLLEETLLTDSSSRKIFVLRGLGGIGKTQLAIRFMRIHHTKFSAVFWLNGNSVDSLKKSIAKYANKISPGNSLHASRIHVHDRECDLDLVVQEILAWLAELSNNRWLLVFDNVDEEFTNSSEPDLVAQTILKFFPTADHGSILITTRLIRLEQLGESYEVKKVGWTTSLGILKSWYKSAAYGTGICILSISIRNVSADSSADESKIKRLLRLLDGLPLAIAQAGAYLQESGMDIEAYLQLYKEQREEVAQLLHGANTSLIEYPGRSVWTTWIISYNAILAQNRHVAHMLVLWSFLDRNDLWYGMFEMAALRIPIRAAFSVVLGNIGSDRLSFSNAMTLLRSYSLIEGSEGSDGYAMHTVVHRWIYFYQGLRYQSLIGTLALTIVSLAVPLSTEREYAQMQRRLFPHAQVCSGRLLGVKAGEANDSSCYERLPDVFSRPELKPTLDAIYMLGILYKDQGKTGDAEQMFIRALKGYENTLGTRHRSTLDTVKSLGNLYSTQGKLDKAERMYKRGHEGSEEAIHACNNLGTLYQNQGKLDEAEMMFKRVLESNEEALGPRHISILPAINNLGSLYFAQGKFDEAEKLYKRALEGNEEALGPTHTRTLGILNNLGNLYEAQDKLDEAEKMFRRALTGHEEALGPKHTSTLPIAYNLGSLYYKQGKLDQAEKTLLQTLERYGEELGPEVTNTRIPVLNTAWRLGDLCSKNRPHDARMMYTKALIGFAVFKGPSSKEFVSLRHSLKALELNE